jgi:hypothetical protein
VGVVIAAVVEDGYLVPSLSWKGLRSCRGSGGWSAAAYHGVQHLGALYVVGLCMVHDRSKRLRRSQCVVRYEHQVS